MTRSASKDAEVACAAPGRRSLRSRPPEVPKKHVPAKGRKSFGKKKDDSSSRTGTKVQENILQKSEDKNDEGQRETFQTSNGESSTKLTSRTVRAGRKRQALLEVDEENDSEVKDPEENELAESSGSKKKSKKKRKPPIKKRKEAEEDETEMWTPLEPLDGDEKRETQRKFQSKNDRRKQALVERQAAAEVMLQKPLPRRRANSDSSECQVLHSVSRIDPTVKTIETVEIDDEVSETGSIQIVAEPDVFDFKRLLIQYRSVNLPSVLWGVHKDPRDQFVSFTRFNPDYCDNLDMVVDRAVIFKGTLHPQVYISNNKIELPDMFNVVETLFETAQVLQFANNTVTPAEVQQ